MSVILLGLPACAQIESKMKSAQTIRHEKTAQLPVCSKPLGTVAVEEADAGSNWWSGQQLPEPTKLIKVFVAKSRCFTLVDRNRGMNAAMRERELASRGELRGRSNIGKGQVKAADYILVPDLVSSNRNAGGGRVAGLLGGLIGGGAGQIAAGLDFKSKTADVVLTLTDVRSSEQVALTEGSAKKNDLGFSGAGALWGGSEFGGAGVGGYANTEIGQVITLAYLDAYTRMVEQLGGVSNNAAASRAMQAVTLIRSTQLLTDATGKGKPVRSLRAGATLHPTGNKQGGMWEVEDELGQRGWVPSELIELSR
ncbi:MAG TPA: CsgG/HfaB family protein [Dyella sp.]